MREKINDRDFLYRHQKMKSPPFGKQAIEYLEKNGPPKNDIWLSYGYGFWGDPWELARQNNCYKDRVGLVLPDPNPAQYKWPVNGCSVLAWVFDLDDDKAQILCRALIQSGALKVRIIQQDTNNRVSMAVIDREVSSAA